MLTKTGILKINKKKWSFLDKTVSVGLFGSKKQS